MEPSQRGLAARCTSSLLLGLTLIVGATASPLSAQILYGAAAGEAPTGGVYPNNGPYCSGPGFPTFFPLSPTASTTCNFPGAFGTALYSNPNPLVRHATATITGLNSPVDRAQMFGGSFMNEVFDFAGLRPAFLDIWTMTDYTASATGDGQIAVLMQSYFSNGECNFFSGIFEDHGVGSIQRVADVTCSVPATDFASFGFLIDVIARIGTLEQAVSPLSGTASVSATATLLGFRFFDATKQDITDKVTMTARSGFNYPIYDGPLTAPEPSTLVATLTGLGFIGSIAQMRRRRRLKHPR